jgi:hypothetical protein
VRPAARAVAAAALLGIAGARCAREAPTGATIVRASALRAFPRETVALLVLEVTPLRGLAAFDRFVKEISSAAEQEGPLGVLAKRFGPETFDRIERLGLAIVPQRDDRVGYAILAEGAFDEQAMRARLGEQEILTVLQIEGRPDFSVTVLKGGSLALGPKQVLDEMRANAGRRSAGIDANSLILDLLRGVRPASNVWGAIDYRTIAKLGRQAPWSPSPGSAALGENPVASALVALVFQGQIVGAPDFEVTGRADDEAGARKLADAARSLVALGRMGVTQQQAADWVAFLDGIRIEQKGEDVLLRAAVPPALMSAMAEKARAAAAAMPVREAGAPPAAPRSKGVTQPPRKRIGP